MRRIRCTEVLPLLYPGTSNLQSSTNLHRGLGGLGSEEGDEDVAGGPEDVLHLAGGQRVEEISDLELRDIPGQIPHTDLPVVHQLRHVSLDIRVGPVNLRTTKLRTLDKVGLLELTFLNLQNHMFSNPFNHNYIIIELKDKVGLLELTFLNLQNHMFSKSFTITRQFYINSDRQECDLYFY